MTAKTNRPTSLTNHSPQGKNGRKILSKEATKDKKAG
jgi:hypothetical protein